MRAIYFRLTVALGCLATTAAAVPLGRDSWWVGIVGAAALILSAMLSLDEEVEKRATRKYLDSAGQYFREVERRRRPDAQR